MWVGEVALPRPERSNMLPGISIKDKAVTFDRGGHTPTRTYWHISPSGCEPCEISLISVSILPCDDGSTVIMAKVKTLSAGSVGTNVDAAMVFGTVEECVEAAKKRLDNIIKPDSPADK